MKQIFIIVIACTTYQFGSAQELIGSAGSHEQQTNGSISYSVGEPITAVYENMEATLNIGFQQVYNSPIVSIDESSTGPEMSVYPNPADEILFVELEAFSGYQIQLISTQGRILSQQRLSGPTTQLEIKDLAPGSYYIRAFSNQNEVKTFRIIKK
jgi:hypothetical protein